MIKLIVERDRPPTTEEKLFSVIAVDDESTYNEWVKKTNAYTAGLKIRRIVRVLDPSLAE